MTVLLVEDDDAVAMVIETILRKEGFVTWRAVDAAEAIASVEENGDMPRLLLADVTLPGGMDGTRLARLLRERFPALPIVLMSGAFENGACSTPEGLARAVLLPKPFRRAALLSAVTSALCA